MSIILRVLTAITLIILLSIPNTLNAQGFEGYEWVNIEPGNRHTGAGSAWLVSSFSPLAVEYNPALLAFSPAFALSFSSQQYDLWGDMSFSHGYVGLTSARGQFGLGLGSRYVDGDGSWVTDYSTRGRGIGLAYRVTENYSIGMSLKQLNNKSTEYSYMGIALGVISRTNYAYSIGGAFTTGNLNEAVIGGYSFEHYFRAGIALRNIGPGESFSDSDIMIEEIVNPQRLNLGLSYTSKKDWITLQLAVEFDKDLIAQYASMDWDSDGLIGGYDDEGNPIPSGTYNESGQNEAAYNDTWLKSIINSWGDDWILGGDRDRDGDRRIGGFNADTIEVSSEEGKYNSDGELEVGTHDAKSFKDELNTITSHLGVQITFADVITLQYGHVSQPETEQKFISYGAVFEWKFLAAYFSTVKNEGEHWAWEEQSYTGIEFTIDGSTIDQLKELLNKF